MIILMIYLYSLNKFKNKYYRYISNILFNQYIYLTYFNVTNILKKS